ncbi:MAG: DUF393 domain-containing protein [Pseudomonadota bacterium]
MATSTEKLEKTTDPAQDLTIYYDGSCPVCTIEISHYRRQIGADRLNFVDVSRADDGSLGDGLDRRTAMARFHVRRADGTLLSGAQGFAEVWDRLPSWRWAARLGRLPGVLALGELLYRAFLPIRPTLSRLAARAGLQPETARQDSAGTRPRDA